MKNITATMMALAMIPQHELRGIVPLHQKSEPSGKDRSKTKAARKQRRSKKGRRK